MKLDRYDIQARLLPAVLCSVPIFLFQYYYLNKHAADFSEAILKLRFLGPITLTIALIYLFMQVNRFIAKEVFEKRYFRNELDMPTTSTPAVDRDLHGCRAACRR